MAEQAFLIVFNLQRPIKTTKAIFKFAMLTIGANIGDIVTQLT